ncbi:DUF58 domain-containing protein [Occallatibacter riparius]|uniref:DUF58 domain-containing protein n=1 Tax=Occallatibacter riparius TaxID=1002689 RepID=A0A9J7BRB4_9BACT|nr:DUF58 domain-containing protein [Occallatibacter riparius]UWZ84298.1 DUF58 domain-containing protein [Occallatibacter riparius]
MITPSLHPEPVRAACERRRKLAYGLTPRAIALLTAGFLLLIPGFYMPRLSYAMLVWAGLVLLAAWLDGLRLPSPTLLTAERSWSNAPALDSETEIELAIENHGRIIVQCILTDDLPAAMAAEPIKQRVTAFPRVSAKVRYRVTPRQRGDCETGSLYIRYRSPLGLAERWALAPLTQTVRVYPALRTSEDQQIFLARSRQIDLQLRQARQRGLGRDFESLREYREGDDLRDICWTATARRGSLITRQYQTERSQAVWIVLDCGRLMRHQRWSGSLHQLDVANPHTKLDYACSTAVALAQLALFSGDRVGLLAYGQNVQQRLLPGRGAAHLRQMIELLAQARAETSEADHLRATAVLNRLQPRRSLILWITDLAETAMRPEVIDGATQLLKRHVLLFVAMAQPEVDRIASARPKTVDEMFRAAAAQEMAGRRELLLARLREQGALTMDLDPEKLTSAVLNQYLTVKERAMV